MDDPFEPPTVTEKERDALTLNDRASELARNFRLAGEQFKGLQDSPMQTMTNEWRVGIFQEGKVLVFRHDGKPQPVMPSDLIETCGKWLIQAFEENLIPIGETALIRSIQWFQGEDPEQGFRQSILVKCPLNLWPFALNGG